MAGKRAAMLRNRLRAALLLVLALFVPLRPLLAQGVPTILRDTETERYFETLSAPLAKSAGLAPGALKIVVIQDPEINAFVAGGQIIYINSGLILAAKDANQIEGVIAHELGHIEGGHIIRNDEGAKPAGRIALLSLLLGLAAVAAGAPEAGLAAMGAGQQVAMSHYLTFSRGQEGSADASAVRHLNDAHVTGKGMISFFDTLRQEEYRLSSSYAGADPYMQTHPMSQDRQDSLYRDLSKSPWWNTPIDPAKQAGFLRVQAKLAGYVLDPDQALKRYPQSNQSPAAHYARAFAWHRSAYPDNAMAEAQALLRAAPNDPYYNELDGQMLLENGHPKEALVPLRKAVAGSDNAPLISSMLGHALVATDDPKNFAEAEQVLRVSVARDRENPLAWYALGTVYAARGDEAHASLATAERYHMQGDDRLAGLNAERAMRGFKVGTVDYLRAEDIALASRNNLDWKERKK
jgi:predicted Zn-dependent protease